MHKVEIRMKPHEKKFGHWKAAIIGGSHKPLKVSLAKCGYMNAYPAMKVSANSALY